MYSPFLGELDEKTGMARTSVHLGGGAFPADASLFSSV